jgi:enoyl-CoA hydratase/carnithine racemase
MYSRTTPGLVRTGFFRSDLPPEVARLAKDPYFFLDPETPLFATADSFRYTDDPTMRNPVLERSNVGMGMLLSNSKWCDMKYTNSMYKRLRDLEVNSLKRFTAVTDSDKRQVLGGLNPREILLIAEAIHMGEEEIAKSYWSNSLRNQADLAIVFADYLKPLVVQIGNTKNSAVALASLNPRSSAYSHSTMEFDLCKSGTLPSGGLSFSLARTQFAIGEFLALTHRKISGPSLLYSGLVSKWISPEAFGFMEVTSEHKLAMSEKDANALLSEHYLQPPAQWAMSRFVPLIDEVFRLEKISDMQMCLEDVVKRRDETNASFAKECLERMAKSCPVSLELTNRLIKRARAGIANRVVSLKSELGEDTATLIQRRAPHAQEHIFMPALIESLNDEILANMMLIERNTGLRSRLHTHLVGGEAISSEFNLSEPEIDNIFARPPAFQYYARSEFPLSAHPKLRKFHPDFNPETGMDHDPIFMANEVARWAPDYMNTELNQMRSAVTGLSVEEIKNRHDLVWE